MRAAVSSALPRLLLLCGLLQASEAFAESVQPAGRGWNAGTGLPFNKKTRRAASGIACPMPAVTGTRCLVVVDEGVEAIFVTLGDQAYTADAEGVPLLASDGELDTEGAATDGSFFYATGSHAVKRSDCEQNPASHAVFRIPRDAATGGVALDSAGAAQGVKQTKLDAVITEAMPELFAALGKCLDDGQGFDVEGLAVSGDRIYFGFRGPAGGGQAPILSLDKAKLFEESDADAKLLFAEVGKGRGIRDLQAVTDGLLVLAGPDDKPNSSAGWTVGLWNEATAPAMKGVTDLDLTPIALADHGTCEDKEIKPEALSVLEETPDYYRVLVLSDGLCDGGAVVFEIKR